MVHLESPKQLYFQLLPPSSQPSPIQERLSLVNGIFRTHAGIPYLANAGQIPASFPVESELQALLPGLSLADKHHIDDLIIEGDCAVIMAPYSTMESSVGILCILGKSARP